MVSQVLSADSHVLEPPDLWTTRMQVRFRDRAPHLEHEFNGRKGDFLVCPPLGPFSPTRLGCAGVAPEELERFGQGGYAACRPGSWDPVERLKDMDFDGLGAEVFYCGYGMLLFSHPDEEFQRDAHRAYNDWAAEYASHAPKRLFPIANISMTDPAEDLKELHRVKRLGFRGIFISNDPLPERRYDNPMWETFWTAVEEYDLPVNVHILTVQKGAQVGANPIVDGVVLPVPAFRAIAEMITAGVLEKPDVPVWVILLAATAISLGTAAGGWRIIRTMGQRVVKLDPVHGFAAETTAATVILTASHFGVPVSTTHVISSAIMGVGSSDRFSAVRWGIAGNIVVAWVLTIPASGLVAGLVYAVLRQVL